MGPNSYYFQGIKSPEQLQAEYNQAMQQYQAMYKNLANPPSQLGLQQPGFPQQQSFQQQSQPQQQANSSVSTIGSYQVVNSYKEVEDTPVSFDGSATLFFDFNNMIFWSKKFVDGQGRIQAFRFTPLNVVSNDDTKQETVEKQEEPDSSDILVQILGRIEALEARMSKPRAKKPEIKEEAQDESI